MYSRDSKIMRKLLGRTIPEAGTSSSNSPSGHENVEHTLAPTSVPTTFRPPKAQDSVYDAGVPVSCLDVSQDGRTVALGGAHILKTISLDEERPLSFSEGVDIRASIAKTATGGPRGSSIADQLNIKDVKWSQSNLIFTACANGRIFAYDAHRIGSDAPHDTVHVQEDSRQIDTLSFSPHAPAWLLSGGKDGVARIFDTEKPIQTRRGYITFRQRWSGLRCIDPINQVAWSPRVGFEIAVGMESGTILKWDVRQPSRPLMRINAHEKACTDISWHPDGLHLISAGSDRKLHVWDMGTSADRRQKPKWTVQTPAPAAVVAWRPGLWSASAGGRRVAQVAVSYDDSSSKRYGTSAVHIFDLARPTMPYKEIERFESSPSGLLWRDQDMLWTVGADGTFNQCDVGFAPRAVDRQSTSAMDISSRGDVLMFLDERPQQPRARASVTRVRDANRSFASSPQTPMSVSRSDSEEDVVGSFLAPKRRMHRRRGSGRRPGLSSTPPHAVEELGTSPNPLGLEDSVAVTGLFKMQQAMAFGHVPAAKSVGVYQYLSSVYLETLGKELPYQQGGKDLCDRVMRIIEIYARAAEAVSLFRLAQTWRIMAFGMSLLLRRRAQYHFETRIALSQKMKSSKFHDGDASRRSSLQDRFPGRTHVTDMGSTSNVPTPLARPADRGVEYSDHAYKAGKMLTPIEEPSSFSIGPNLHGPSGYEPPQRKRLESTPISITSETSEETQKSSTEGYDFYDMDALVEAIDVPHSNDSSWGTVSTQRRRSTLSRNDSSDSYDVFPLPQEDGSLGRKGGLPQEDSVMSEYQSRIRGETMSNGSDSSPERFRRHMADSPEDVFMISQTTDPADEPVSRGSVSDTPRMSPPKSPKPPSPAKPRQPTIDATPHIIEPDFLPWDDDPPYPHPLISSTSASSGPPLDPETIITRTLAFESKTSPLTPAAIILLLRPLVAEDTIPLAQATAILRQHHNRLTSMSLFTEAAQLRNLALKGWMGLPDWGEDYPTIFATAQRDVKVSYLCSSCKRPREIDPADAKSSVWFCDRCKSVMAPCAVCQHREPEPSSFMPSAEEEGKDDSLSGWWYCPICAHGGHASCLTLWHKDQFSSGCCPLDGCGHACLPGRYRSESFISRADEVSRAVGSVSGTSTPKGPGPSEVLQSKAVGMAREVLSAGASILSSSPGRGGERERRKSVKFAKTEN
ncbi:uncharacterized protein F5Z01DRAFT_621804 [Emericellopsis atlantica]|uniref:WD repeat protein n=1 Tax=Emericellopsis atlantica TaxID=2614577 RepID=A0A9P7ZML4_9HYPO|nr:uncharacterized protein F5Z01DRAFT_621804 [Emericellopsis atlantica]KAG9254815.1 hypothetical protein F5Z01DRAFT_621804 [Emericellopsis atlantica]